MAFFNPFVFDATDDEQKVPIIIAPMTAEDADNTAKNRWQTDWTSEYMSNEKLLKYAAKTKDGELIGLAAYEIEKRHITVYLTYMESHPESNPTLTKAKKYKEIGRVLVAYGIKLSLDQGFWGAVVLHAKTPELEKHYIQDFGAQYIPSPWESGAPRYIIQGSAASKIFNQYLSEEGEVNG